MTDVIFIAPIGSHLKPKSLSIYTPRFKNSASNITSKVGSLNLPVKNLLESYVKLRVGAIISRIHHLLSVSWGAQNSTKNYSTK